MVTIKRITAAVLILILTVVTPATNTVAVADESGKAPYLYYYSDRLNAFVIERADGTDARVIGQRLVTDGLPYGTESRAYGPGISSRGDWLALSTSVDEGGGWRYSPSRSFVFPFKNPSIYLELDGYKNADLIWSPNQNRLAAVSVYTEDSAEPTYTHIRSSVRDMTTNKIYPFINEKVYVGDNLYRDLRRESVIWLDNDVAILRAITAPNDSPMTFAYNIMRIGSSDYNVSTVYLSDVIQSVTQSSQFPLYPIPGAIDYMPSTISATGNVAQTRYDDLLIFNLLTLERQFYNFRIRDAKSAFIQWSPDGQYALLHTSQYHLIDVKTQEVKPLILPSDKVKSIQWTPDGEHIIIVTRTANNSNGDIYLTDKLGQKLTLITGVDPSVQLLETWWRDYYLSSSNVIDWVARQGKQYQYYRYYVDTDARTMIELPVEVDERATLSPNGRYIVSIEDSTRIIDVEQNTIKELSPLTFNPNTDYGGEIIWSADSKWFIAFDNAFASGGGGTMRTVGVSNTTGTIRRNLTYIGGLTANLLIGWLPEDFDVSNLAEPLPNPIYPRPVSTYVSSGKTYVYGMHWSPDSKQLLIGNELCNQQFEQLAVWDIETNTKVCLRRGEPYGGWVKWIGEGETARLDLSQLTPNVEVWATLESERSVEEQQIVWSLPFDPFVIAISPDHQYVAVANGWDVDIYRLSDLITW